MAVLTCVSREGHGFVAARFLLLSACLSVTHPHLLPMFCGQEIPDAEL